MQVAAYEYWYLEHLGYENVYESVSYFGSSFGEVMLLALGIAPECISEDCTHVIPRVFVYILQGWSLCFREELAILKYS